MYSPAVAFYNETIMFIISFCVLHETFSSVKPSSVKIDGLMSFFLHVIHLRVDPDEDDEPAAPM